MSELPNTYCPHCYAPDPNETHCDECGRTFDKPFRAKVCDDCGHWYGRDDLRSCNTCHPMIPTPPPAIDPTGKEER